MAETIAIIRGPGGEVVNKVDPEDLVYSPTDAQRLVKARFWDAWKQNPTMGREEVSAVAVEHLIGDRRIIGWWKKPLFKEWFLDEEDYVYKSKLLAEKGQDVLAEMLNDPTVPASIRAKIALSCQEAYAKILAKRSEAKFLDKQIQDASPEQLKQLIQNLEKGA